MQKKTGRRQSFQLSSKMKIAIVVSRFNKKISSGLFEGARKALLELGLKDQQIKTFFVAGAFEIPLIAKKIGQSDKFAGVVALGCVIRGETPHFEYVSLGATLGCQIAQLDTGCPVALGVLTVDTEAQAISRSSNDAYNKGREAVLALLESLATIQQL